MTALLAAGLAGYTFGELMIAVIIIAAVAYSAVAFRARRKRGPQTSPALETAEPVTTSTIHTETRGD